MTARHGRSLATGRLCASPMSNCRQPCQRPAGPSIAIPASAGRERALLLQRWLHSNPRGRGIAAGPGVQAEGVGLRAAPGSPNRQSRTPEEKCNVARCPSPISRRSLVLKVTTCPHFVRNAVPCSDGTRNPVEFLISSPHPQDQESHLSSCRNRIESIPRPRLAFHVLVIGFPCLPGSIGGYLLADPTERVGRQTD